MENNKNNNNVKNNAINDNKNNINLTYWTAPLQLYIFYKMK